MFSVSSMKFETWYYHEVFQQKCCMISCFLCPCYMSCPSKAALICVLDN
jgi:hypothetical protein